MKKFLLSLCAIAVASACVFMTSCKDDDENYDVKTQVNLPASFVNDIKAKQDANYNYTYEVNGKVCNNEEELKAAIAELPAGQTAQIKVTATPKSGSGAALTSTSDFVVPAAKASEATSFNYAIAIPTAADQTGANNKATGTASATETISHSGGAAK